MKTLPERAVLLHIGLAWRQINRDQFRSALRSPSFEMSDAEQRLGAWVPQFRTIRLSRRLLAEYDWFTLLEVLRHEMAHQYVSEVLRVADETAHGQAFQRVCAEFGVDSRASGTPSPSVEDTKLVKRIRSLLALAASPNQNEAQAAARKAFSLMHRHNVTVGQAPAESYEARRIGPCKGRFQAHEKVLAGLLGSHFFVRPIYVPMVNPTDGKTQRTLEVSGRPENLAMAEHIYTWLESTGERLFQEYKVEHKLRGNGERRRFLLGIVSGFARQLDDQRRVCEETGLVWVGDAGLDDFVGKRHPHLRRSRGARFHATDAYRSGLAKGQRLDMNRPVQAGPSGSVRQIGTKK